jgi:hypothetical protein
MIERLSGNPPTSHTYIKRHSWGNERQDDRMGQAYQTMAEDHARKSVGECHPYREFEGMQPSI